MIEVQNTDVNIVKNLIPMRNHMPASAYGLKAISDWFITGKTLSLLENGWVAFDLIQIEKKGGATLLNVGIAHQFAYLLIYTLLNSEPSVF